MAVSLEFSFHYLLLIVLLSPANSQAYSHISLGSYITAGKSNNSYWTSKSGDFAFGFQQVNNDGYLLAIWFNKTPETTIVWSCSRNNLAEAGSTLQLTKQGWLVLKDSSGNIVWIANSDETGVHHATMLDTGNFVLARRDSVFLWESFDHPTDTMLPTQTLNIGQQLLARYSERNHSSGRFKFILQSDGNLVLYATNFPFDISRSAYWATQTDDGSGYQVIYSQSGYMYLSAGNGSQIYSIFSYPVSMEEFYQRATIDHDGVLRLYVYPKKSASNRGLDMTWITLSSIPSNLCLAIVEPTGSEPCGLNSYCEIEVGKDSLPNCKCPPGYVLLDPNDKNKGCKQNFVSQSCDKTVDDSDQFEFKEMSNTDWVWSDYAEFDSVSEDWCRQGCLTDCHCGLVLYADGHCHKKKIPLSNGRTDPSITLKALIKVRKDNNGTTAVMNSDSKNKGLATVVLTESLILGSSVFLNVLFLVATFVFFFYKTQQKRKMLQSLQLIPGTSLQSFTYSELEAVTGQFKEELGSGNFGTVYKAVLENGECIAVKKLDSMPSIAEQEFRTEICTIGRTNHKNLVKLLGFCNEDQHRLFVYEYMKNGCLANHLFGTSRPNWNKRKQIALGVARGLNYLHQECNLQIIHCDIKHHNILLDESMTAKISDFGLAKLLKLDQTRSTTMIRGTRGYVAPEWFMNMPITTKVDVYSFGILLLQLICCKQRVNDGAVNTSQETLADWAHECYKEGKLHLLVENDEDALDDMVTMEKYVMVAMWCVQEDPSIRPTMKKVMLMLEGVVQVYIPPNPYSYFSSI